MSIIKEIHEQPEWLRTLLFGLTVVTVIALGGYMALTSFERGLIMSLNPEDGEERIARLSQERPNPLRSVREQVGSAVANIGDILGFDASEGFDIEPQKDDNQDRVYLFPLSE